jgi:Polysaccharide biosynthesis C-terminal domain
MWNDLASLGLLPIAFLIGSRWGISGIAWGWVVAYPFVAIPLYWKTIRTIGMGTGEYLRALRPALSGTLVMVVAVVTTKYVLPPNQPLLVRLAVEIVIGALAYTGAVLLLHEDRATMYINMARHLRQAEGN